MSMGSPASMKTLVTRSMASWLPVVTMISLSGSASIFDPAMNLESSPLSSPIPFVAPYWSILAQASGGASAYILLISATGRLPGS